MEIRRKALLLAGAGSCAMAVVHVFLPDAYGWREYMNLVPHRVATAVLATNLFLSFLLLWGGCLTILAALRRRRLDLLGNLILYGLATFWAMYVLYQLRVPPAVSDPLRKTLTTVAAVIAALYLWFLFTRGAERAEVNAGMGTAAGNSATGVDAGPEARSSYQ